MTFLFISLFFFLLLPQSKPRPFYIKMEILSILNLRRNKTRPQLLLPTKHHPLTLRHETRPLNQPLLLIKHRLQIISTHVRRVFFIIIKRELIRVIVESVLFAQHEIA